MTSGSGDGALAAVQTIGYDELGNVATVDGPLAGSADTQRLRYNLAREPLGEAGPDPDGAGPLRHRARRVTYNADGQVSRVESGTVTDQSDAAWTAFAASEALETDYDAAARPFGAAAGGGRSGAGAPADQL